MGKFFAGILSIGFLVVSLSSEASAQSRYSFEKIDHDNILRLDSQTGQIDKCAVEKDGVKCTLSADDRVALEKQITDLKTRVAELETGKDQKPIMSKKEIDQAFDMMKYFADKFQGIMKDEQKEQTPLPQSL